MSSIIYNVMKSPDQLKPHPENIKIYGDETPDEKLIESVRENGILEMLIITESDTIISGHRRWLAAKECGLEKIPCIIRKYETPLAEKHEIVEHNRQRLKSHIQMMREGEVHQEWQDELARRRMSEGGKGGIDKGKQNFADLGEVGQARDAIGAELGMSGWTYEKAKTVYDYAKDGDELAMFYTVEVDAGRKSIDKAYKEFIKVNGKDKSKLPTFNKRALKKCSECGQEFDSIEWAKWSWNPVTGCRRGCDYCYARDIGIRFSGTFEPTFHPERLTAPKNTPFPPNPTIADRNVFVVSMGDLFGEWVPDDWIKPVFKVVKESPEWNFLFLTKSPERLLKFEFPKNAWVGTTVDIQSRVKPAEESFKQIKATVKFLSCEPFLEPLKFNDLSMFDWVIIGGRSRNSAGPEFQPEWSWVESLLNQARSAGIKVYFKPNLNARPKEYPEGD
ncbi:MAG: DUF5131 family protein [Paludibacter sp.]|nr:DUF5131 family protein [Paludibacter sp.]